MWRAAIVQLPFQRPAMRPENIAFIGVSDVTRYHQYTGVVEAGCHVVPGAQIVSEDAWRALGGVVTLFAERCDTGYVSLDVDVLGAAIASGTGHMTMGGIQSGRLLDVYEEPRAVPICGWTWRRWPRATREPAPPTQIFTGLLFESCPAPSSTTSISRRG